MIKNILMILYINSVIVLLLSVTLVSKDAWGLSAETVFDTTGRIAELLGKIVDRVPTSENDLTSSPSYPSIDEEVYPSYPSIDEEVYPSYPSIKQQWTQIWTQFENQLVVLSPYEQEMALSNVRMVLYSLLSPYSPDQQQEAISELSETMSPELASSLLF